MSKLKKYRKSGETLVEVMVCAVLFLMMAAVMQGAVSFGTNALHRSTQIRKTNAEICRNLRVGVVSTSDNGSAEYRFRATSMDGNTEGNEVFTIKVPLVTKKVSYKDGQNNDQTTDFYLYGSAAGGTGGGGP